jgi:hypothetical protein
MNGGPTQEAMIIDNFGIDINQTRSRQEINYQLSTVNYQLLFHFDFVSGETRACLAPV